MVRRREEQSAEPMIDMTYRQSSGGRELVAVLQKIYLCASVEFLMAVSDFFLQALPQNASVNTASATGDRLPLKRTTEPWADNKPGKTRMQRGTGLSTTRGAALSIKADQIHKTINVSE